MTNIINDNYSCLCGHFEWCEICQPDSPTKIVEKEKLKNLLPKEQIIKWIDNRIRQLEDGGISRKNPYVYDLILNELEGFKRFINRQDGAKL